MAPGETLVQRGAMSRAPVAAAAAFVPSPLHSWPPFFTLQPQEVTRQEQLEQWGRLLLSWCAFHRQAVLPALREWPLWENKAIARAFREESSRPFTVPFLSAHLSARVRRAPNVFATAPPHPPFFPNPAGALPPAGIEAVATYLVSRGQAEWADGAAHAALRVFWKTPAEWAALILAHVTEHGLGGELLTVYELHSGSASLGSPMEGLEAATLVKALEVLASQGKAQIKREPVLDEYAVRFLA